MAEGEVQLLLEINTLTIKKEYLFNKLQKAYDVSKTVKLDSLDSVQNYMVQFSELDDARSDFEKIVMQLIMLEMQSNPKVKPSTSALESFDELYYVCKKVAMNCNRIVQEPTKRNLTETKDDCLARPVLPKMTLFEFDGQMENWATFHDTFVSLVHNRKFENIDKFHYLLSCVKGPALSIVRSLPITSYNYPLVWQSLLDKYQDVRALTGRYLDKMLNFLPLTKDSVANLSLFVETFDHSLKAIHALQIENLDDYLFCHLALRGLDSHTRKLFEESRDQNKLPTFADLINFVNKQIKVLEHTFPTTGSRTTSNQQVKVKSSVSFTQPSHKQANFKYSNATTSSQKVGLAVSRLDTQNNSNQNKLTCVHCNSNHLIYRCEQFRKLLVQDRIDHVNSLKLCANCLKNNHETSSCKSNMTCGVCSRPHHYLLHRDTSVLQTPAVPTSQTPRAAVHAAGPSPPRSVSMAVLPDPTVTENFHSVTENSSSYGVVLGTTRTLVVDITGQHQNCRAVLDSGAQSSFITLNCAQRLGLPRTKCPYTVSGLGGELIKNFGMVTCDLKPCKSDVPSFRLDLVVVEKVSSEMPNVSFPPEVVEEYKKFNLADPLFFERSSVDILLDNGVVSDWILDKPINVKPNIPKCGGLVLKKWSSNCEELFERVPVDHRETTVTFQKDRNDVSIKLLGLKWSPVFDAFSFSLNKQDTVNTKRSVLKTLASIYDPVGYIAPCTFVAKYILQDLWKVGLGWDDHLPQGVCEQWLTFITELPRLSELQIQRHLLLPNVTECELVGFIDASSRGYAACIYVISRSQSDVKCRLLMAKSKVAPIKVQTIPRMELMAAALLARLTKYACECLTRVNVTRITALTDSTIVLAWLQTDAYKLKTFVCNRVTQIIEAIPPHAWRHVNSENNMADVASRGVSPSQFMADSAHWFEGPAWMYYDREIWPVSTYTNENETNIPEVKSNSCTFSLMSQNLEEAKLEFVERVCNRYSSYSRMQRSIAWILRLLRRFRDDVSICHQVLTTEDLNAAHDSLIKLVQAAYFKDQIETLKRGETYIPSLRKLAPFLDACGFLRVGGRITQSDLPYNAKHPLLLPKQSRFTKLLVEYFHIKYLHTGPQTLQNIINQRYWILSARSLIRSIHAKCKNCFKCKPTLLQPKMGDLPSTRLMPNKVFEHVGVDLAGPFYIKESLRRNAKTEKAYLAVFVCFSTKAVHLETLSSLSADCFLATLDRFVSRRGLSACFYSDCGTNFIATSKHLADVQKFMSDNRTQRDILNGCAQRLINWQFNAPSASHMGGLWESCVRIAKYHFVRAVGDKALTFEELSTVFCKIEAIMNSRPLCASD